MTMSMPDPISAYFAADGRDGGAVSECFTDEATVRDEGKTYTGRAAISDWKASSSRKFAYTVAPFAIENADGRLVVTAKVAGNFPASPIDLRYLFVVEDGKIASLEIKS